MASTPSTFVAPRTPLTFSSDAFFHVLMHIEVKDQHLVFLWTTCRGASKDFKDAVERVFITRHLKKTSLKVDADLFEYCNALNDGEIVTQIRRHANNSPLPGLKFNFKKLEIKVNWMGMYSEWCREKEHKRHVGNMVDDLEPQILEMQRKVERGEMREMDSFGWILDTYGNPYDDAWKQIRRERLSQHFREGMNWDLDSDDEETISRGYERLKEVIYFVSLEDPYSGEEFVSEDEEGSASEGNSEVNEADED
ncbi:hypothetical protein V5O48_017645 [Marasmius crinis-equi]|uniref:Uncharacterized protein n=1 Tax=Marasmius crinis-equi TaxID=585013 RepID=A0ABR3END4_9AGAR